MNDTHRTIDWQAAHDRLRAAEASLEAAVHPDADAVRKLLDRNAARLAEPRSVETDRDAGLALLVFQLGDERFAVEMAHVREVGQLPACTPVPGGPEHLLGVVLHRGEVRSVIDPARLLHRDPGDDDRRRFFLHLAADAGDVRLCVDGIDEIIVARRDDLLAPDDEQSAALGRFVHTVHRSGVVVLDSAALIAGRQNTAA